MQASNRAYFTIPYDSNWVQKLKNWAAKFEYVSILDSHSNSGYSYPDDSKYDLLMGVGCIDVIENVPNAFERLQEFHARKKDWLFGFFSYDLKNQLEDLTSSNVDEVKMPCIHFFQPKYVFSLKGDALTIGLLKGESFDSLKAEIDGFVNLQEIKEGKIQVTPRIKHADYIKAVLGLKHHIQIGDIYEVNFCQEFYANHKLNSPWNLYQKLTQKSSTPFACFHRVNDKYLMCASPERYLKKEGVKLISQPIKGTVKRGENSTEDKQLAHDLYINKKERSENVMIVDLVRNDLSIVADKGSVKVPELYGIYEFPQVFQMISTVEARLRDGVSFSEALRKSFPMGSMTGAPKIKSMELIEQFESTKRGLYSGSVGYISPDADFDFNVVIRSIQYNESEQFLNFMVGGAITSLADPESEFQESLLKAKAIFEILE